MTFLLVFFISFIATVFLTPYLINLLEKSGIMDHPEERKVHKDVKPRMGGLVIFIVVFTLTLTFYVDIAHIRFFLLGMIFISVCGSVDDVRGMKWNTKFLLQSISVILLMFFLFKNFNEVTLLGYIIPDYISFPLIFLFILGTLNSINLMDGMDGLVTSYSLLTAVILFLLALNSENLFAGILLIALSGSLIGFLKFNAFPARIFLGDFGSLLLGYLLVAFASYVPISYSADNLELSFPILLLSIPIIDTVKVFVRRIVLNKHPFLPDKEHLHHIIYRNRVRHKTTVFLILFYNLGFIAIALYSLVKDSSEVLLLYIPMVLGLIFARPIFNQLSRFERFKSFFTRLSEFPAWVFSITKQIIVPLTTLSLIAILVLLFPSASELSTYNILLMLVLGLIVISLAVFHRKKNQQIVLNIYLFFNAAIYLVLANYSGSILNASFLFNNGVRGIVIAVSISIILMFVVLFVVGREKIFPKERIFLSGIDLTMAVVVIGSFMMENMFPRLIGFNFAEAVFLAYLIYIWFKVIQYFKPKLAEYVFYGSFVLPLIALVSMLFYNGF